MSHSTGTIISLQLCTGRREPMLRRETLQAVANLGLEGDHHAKADSSRQVLLIDEETLGLFGLAAGDVRENITTRGIVLKQLASGARVRAGAALLEITIPCTPCDFIEGLGAGFREQMRGQRGMLARVVQGGEIRIGDSIEVL